MQFGLSANLNSKHGSRMTAGQGNPAYTCQSGNFCYVDCKANCPDSHTANDK